MVVDLENLQTINVGVNGIATVGAGVRLGNLALGLYNQAKRALPHGTCPGVGIGGHFTHGGYGYDSRKWGLALDTIVALDVVLANGSFVHATAKTYPKLYYVSSALPSICSQCKKQPFLIVALYSFVTSGPEGSCRILWYCHPVLPTNAARTNKFGILALWFPQHVFLQRDDDEYLPSLATVCAKPFLRRPKYRLRSPHGWE